MSGDILNGWPEDGEPVSELTAQEMCDMANAAQERITALEARIVELEAVVDALKLERIAAHEYDQVNSRDFTLAQRKTDAAIQELSDE